MHLKYIEKVHLLELQSTITLKDKKLQRLYSGDTYIQGLQYMFQEIFEFKYCFIFLKKIGGILATSENNKTEDRPNNET